MILVADESVDFGIIDQLRTNGFSVLSIAEEKFGIKDEEVLAISVENNALLLTEDKDFGELTYRLKLKHKGILLIRLFEVPRIERIDIVAELITKHLPELHNNFAVVDKRGVRIKTAHKNS